MSLRRGSPKRDSSSWPTQEGVDSSLLAFVSCQVLGKAALAVILKSEVLPKSELLQAVSLAKSLGLNCLVARLPS